MKLKDEVGIGGPKSTNKICWDIHIHYSYIPMLAFLDYHAPVDGDPYWCYPSINLNLLCTWEKFILSTMLILGGGGIISLDHCITAWLVNFCTYSKSKHRAFNTVGVLIQFINFKNVSSTN